MAPLTLPPGQLAVRAAAPDSKLFLSGPAGTGKSTAAVERLNYLLGEGIPGESILVLTPQRTLQEPYLDIIRSPEHAAGGEVTPATVGGLARRMCDLFWPLVSEKAGFAHPDRPPIFLTLETAQYYMAHLVRPLVDQGYFESVTIDRNRLYSQILDNLNKAAAVGFPASEIGARLDSAWEGDPGQRRIYLDAQDCANRFREFCLRNNLLDFSLQLEVFWNNLWPESSVVAFLERSYRHLIYDNLEEDVPRAHDLIRAWLPKFDSVLLIYDADAGYRRFLGADPGTAYALRALCDREIIFDQPLVMSEEIAGLEDALTGAMAPPPTRARSIPPAVEPQNFASPSLNLIFSRFYPELLDSIVAQIQTLLAEDQLSPSQIVILTPFLSD